MILARVALGRTGLSSGGSRVPNMGCDSAVSGDICCVFKNEAAYPQWVIVFDSNTS